MNREKLKELTLKLRERNPQIHCITNYVTTQFVANALLSVGARPVMADNPLETAEITAVSDALVLNLGTMKESTPEAMINAGKSANRKGIPVVLDPVGVTSSEFRKKVISELLGSVDVSVIKGNKSELDFIAGLGFISSGVDDITAYHENEYHNTAVTAAKKTGCVCAVTGVNDFISDGTNTVRLDMNVSMLKNITGSGCAGTALIAAYATVCDDMITASDAGISALCISAMDSYKNNTGTGTFYSLLLDNLYFL